jgi:RNA 3'-terminal phosphate cyclase (ATP)
VPVFEHLADQLLLPMALGKGGVFRTVAPSEHFRTQITLLGIFLGTRVEVTEEKADVFRIEVTPGAA